MRDTSRPSSQLSQQHWISLCLHTAGSNGCRYQNRRNETRKQQHCVYTPTNRTCPDQTDNQKVNRNSSCKHHNPHSSITHRQSVTKNVCTPCGHKTHGCKGVWTLLLQGNLTRSGAQLHVLPPSHSCAQHYLPPVTTNPPSISHWALQVLGSGAAARLLLGCPILFRCTAQHRHVHSAVLAQASAQHTNTSGASKHQDDVICHIWKRSHTLDSATQIGSKVPQPTQVEGPTAPQVAGQSGLSCCHV